jgi:hypothetical protein
VLGGIAELLAVQHATPIISKMGYRAVWFSSLSESNRSNTRQNAMPKFGPLTIIDAHSMGIGIILVTAPVTLAVAARSTHECVVLVVPVGLQAVLGKGLDQACLRQVELLE